MTITELEARVAEITKAVEQSVQNHNSLLGRLDEAKFILQEMKKDCPCVEPVEEAV